MAGQTELLLARARERFVVQDYYGAVHLLESVVDSGRAFAESDARTTSVIARFRSRGRV